MLHLFYFRWVPEHTNQSANNLHVHKTQNNYLNNSHHLVQKYAWIFVLGHYLFREANSFLRTKLEENCELRGTDNVQGQVSEHIFAPNGDYCLNYPSNLFRNVRSFENWGIFSDIPQFLLGNIRSHDTLKRIAYEQKDLMPLSLHNPVIINEEYWATTYMYTPALLPMNHSQHITKNLFWHC